MNALTRDLASLSARLVTDIVVYDRFDDIEAGWLALEAGRHVSLHHSLVWCRAWADVFAPELAIVVGKRGPKTVFILPLEIVSGRTSRIARFIAAPYSNLNTGLFAESLAFRATEAVMAEVGQRIASALAGRADMLQLANIPPVWRGVPNPFLLLPSIENQNCAYQLPILDTFEQTLAQVSAKRKRKKFRVSAKRIEALGGYDHVVAAEKAEKLALLDLFFAQKAERFQAMGLPNVFREENVQSFFRNAVLSEGTDTDYALALHALRIRDGKGSIAAIAGLSRKGDHIICQFGSIDEDAAPHASPGEFLFHMMIEEANKTGAALFDFGIGDQLYKRNWCPVETPHRDVLMAITARGRLGVAVTTLITRTKAAIKRNGHLYAFIQKIRAGKATAKPAPENED